jgi:hypothetical protein
VRLFWRRSGLDDQFRELAEEFRALDPTRQEEVALGLSLLWDAFLARIGSIDEFRSSPSSGNTYIAELRQASQRIRSRPTEDRFYFLAPAMMALYISCFLGEPEDEAVRDDHEKIASLIDLGRRIRPQSRNTVLSRFCSD